VLQKRYQTELIASCAAAPGTIQHKTCGSPIATTIRQRIRTTTTVFVVRRLSQRAFQGCQSRYAADVDASYRVCIVESKVWYLCFSALRGAKDTIRGVMAGRYFTERHHASLFFCPENSSDLLVFRIIKNLTTLPFYAILFNSFVYGYILKFETKFCC